MEWDSNGTYMGGSPTQQKGKMFLHFHGKFSKLNIHQSHMKYLLIRYNECDSNEPSMGGSPTQQNGEMFLHFNGKVPQLKTTF